MARYLGTAQIDDCRSLVEPRPSIALSWRRSSLCGVDPRAELDGLDRHEVDPDSPLLLAARPVLRQMVADLADLPLAVLLAGRDGLVLDVHSSARRGQLAEMARTRIGRRCTEDLVGTNSIGTVLEVRSRIHIRGDEHYLESLRSLECIGAPITHPVTGRMEGVLSICGGPTGRTAELGPFISYATRDIENRLLSGTPHGHLRLLSAFQAASRRHPEVVVLAEDLVLATPAAAAVLGPSDHDLFRERGAHLRSGDVARDEAAELSSGRIVGLTVRTCGTDAGDGLLVEIRPAESDRRVAVPRGSNVRFSAKQVVARELDRARRDRRRTLVTGERGTGRSTVMRQLAGASRLITLECADAVHDGRQWDTRLDQALRGAAGRPEPTGAHPPPDTPPALVVLEDIDLLPAATALRTLERVAESDAWVALTAPPPEGLRGEHAALVACCESRVHLQPLRARAAELPTMVHDITAGVSGPDGGKTPRWTPAALAALAAHSWPGNLHELRAVVRQAARGAVDGCVTPETLPSSVGRGSTRSLRPLQRSEREVISATLRACNGNKVHVATHLGISRTTLYKRMRELGITGV